MNPVTHRPLNVATAHQGSWIDATSLDVGASDVDVGPIGAVSESLGGRVMRSSTTPLWSSETVARSDAYERARRVLDCAVAIVGLVILAPLLLGVAFAIVLDSPGRPVYRQKRVGQHGRPFQILKLRTMLDGAEGGGQVAWAQRMDPRVTRVGMILRKSHLDEIPQLWNVLRGDMSLIGPRPERPEFVAQLADRLVLYDTRHVVRPGITGWAQVQFRYAASVTDAGTKLQYDLYYIQRRSFLLDLVILLKTVLVVLSFTGW